MARLTWADPALADLERICDYIARDSPRQASLLVQRAFAATDRLSDFPRPGRVVPECGNDTIRELLLQPYGIVYILTEGEVLIVMVQHSAVPLPDLPELPT